MRKTSGSVYLWVLTLGMAALFVGWRAMLIVPNRWSVDEGAFATASFWLQQGHALYSHVSVYAYPFMIEFLALVFRACEPSLYAARLAVLAMAAVYLLVAAVTARLLTSAAGLAVCMAVLLLDSQLFKLSGWALAEVPALTVIALAVLLAFLALKSGKRTYLYAASLVCGCGFLVKPLAAPAILWIGLVIWARNVQDHGSNDGPRYWVALVKDVLFCAVLFLAPFLVCLLLYERESFVRYVFLTPIALRKASGWDLAGNVQKVGEYLSGNRAAVLLALAGLPLGGVAGRGKRSLRLMAWLLFVLFLLGVLWHTPLTLKHCVVLSLPLSILAAMSAADVIRIAAGSSAPGYRILCGALALGAVGVAVYDLPAALETRNNPPEYTQGGQEDLARQILTQVTLPGEIIISDDMGMAFTAGRMLPPELSDVSFNQIQAGNLTDSDALSALDRYGVQTVCLWTVRLEWLHSFASWVKDHFASVTRIDEHRLIFHGRAYAAPEDIEGLRPVPGNRLGDAIELSGYTLEPEQLRPGQQARLILYWRALRQVPQDFQVFVHLVDVGGAMVSQTDGPPLNGLHPTSQWKPNQIVADVHGLSVPDGAQPQDFRIWVGMYDLSSLGRLPAMDPVLGKTLGDYLELRPLGMSPE